jgi:predicted CxxxxCH...CXXCH cytochrome family protein
MKNCLRGGAIMVPAVMAALSFGCSSSSKGGGTGTGTSTGTSTTTAMGPSFSTVYGPILSVSCTNATCHYSGAEASPAAGSLDMSSQATAYMNLVGAAVTTPAGPLPAGETMCTGERVVPGDSSMSLMYLKVSEMMPPCGVQMPEVGANLTPAQIATIKTWIDEGANE